MMNNVALPAVKRPVVISLLSALLFLGAVTIVVRVVLLHVTGLGMVFRVLAAVLLAGIAVGLWKLHNGARIFFFFLLSMEVAGSLIALFMVALRQAQYRFAIELAVVAGFSALIMWYLQRQEVRRAFRGASAWPKTVRALVLTVFTTLLAFPFFWMAIATFKQNLDLYATDNNPFLFNMPPTLDHLRYLFRQTDYGQWLINTTWVGLVVVIITLLLSVPAAYALARLTGKWGERIGIGIFLTYLVPPTLLFIPLSRVVANLGLQDSLWSLVLVYPSVTIPFSIWLLMGFFKSIPRELEDAAMVDGLTRFGAFVKLVIPISISGILTVVIFAFTLVTQEYVYAVTFISPQSKQMVGVGVPNFLVLGDVYYWGGLMAACLIASLPIAFLYNLFLDRFIAGFTVGAVKG
jgi:multiple sugar transport system permease protein